MNKIVKVQFGYNVPIIWLHLPTLESNFKMWHRRSSTRKQYSSVCLCIVTLCRLGSCTEQKLKIAFVPFLHPPPAVPGAVLSLCFVKYKMIASNFPPLLTGRRAGEQHVSGFRGPIHSVRNKLFKSPCYRNTSLFCLNSVRYSVILNLVWHWNLRGATDLYKEVMLRQGE